MIKDPYKNNLLIKSLNKISTKCKCDIGFTEIVEGNKQNFSILIEKQEWQWDDENVKMKTQDKYFIENVDCCSDFLAKLEYQALEGAKGVLGKVNEFDSTESWVKKWEFLIDLSNRAGEEYYRVKEEEQKEEQEMG